MSAAKIPPMVQALCDSHVMIMQSGGLACRWLDRISGNPHDPVNLRIASEAGGLANLSARLMGHRLVADRLWRVHGRLPGMAELGVAPAMTSQTKPAAAPKFLAATGAARGRLRNGNPCGDYLRSPRCGARTRSGGCCRQPAMKNGRCRMHGGLSTGPRTSEGRARCRRARLVHGFRGQPVLRFRRRAAQTARHLRDLNAAFRLAVRQGIPAGHGVHRQILSSATASRFPDPIGVHRRVSAVESRFPAGHGVHRPDSISPVAQTNRAHLCSSVSFRGSNPAIPAGHGLHRPFIDRARAAA